MTTREFEAKDRKALSTLYLETRRQCFDWLDVNSLQQSDFDRDTAGEKIWVCEVDGKLVGFISVDESDNFIHHLFILPQFSRLGYAAQLLQTCLNNIGRPARLKCVAANINAFNFYQAKGWHTVSMGLSVDGEYHLMETDRPGFFMG
ncbi:MAG: GNAT family N-acetyltransferase [Pseudohongiella sp.]|nr:GNAT family N-acetyltransferase [Pseudohongiella sp.]